MKQYIVFVLRCVLDNRYVNYVYMPECCSTFPLCNILTLNVVSTGCKYQNMATYETRAHIKVLNTGCKYQNMATYETRAHIKVLSTWDYNSIFGNNLVYLWSIRLLSMSTMPPCTIGSLEQGLILLQSVCVGLWHDHLLYHSYRNVNNDFNSLEH